MTVHERFRKSYYKYYKNRGIPPTMLSAWVGFKDEFLNKELSDTIIYNVSSNTTRFMGIPIKWHNHRRIECLPRRKSSYPRIKPMPNMPLGNLYYPNLTNP